MKWKKPINYDKRIVKRFALLPIEADKEVRWLETVYIEQEYREYFLSDFRGWENNWFVTKKEYLDYKRGKENE